MYESTKVRSGFVAGRVRSLSDPVVFCDNLVGSILLCICQIFLRQKYSGFG